MRFEKVSDYVYKSVTSSESSLALSSQLANWGADKKLLAELLSLIAQLLRRHFEIFFLVSVGISSDVLGFLVGWGGRVKNYVIDVLTSLHVTVIY